MQSITPPSHVMNENHGTDLKEQDEQSRPMMCSESLLELVNSQQTPEIQLAIPGDSSMRALSPTLQPKPPADQKTLHVKQWLPGVERYFRAWLAKQQQKPPEVSSETLESITNVSKILTPVALGVILAIFNMDIEKLSGTQAYNWIIYAEIPTQDAAALLMILGMYKQKKQPGLSKWLQSTGHLLCLEGFFLIQAPFLKLPLPFVPFTLVFMAVLFGLFKIL